MAWSGRLLVIGFASGMLAMDQPEGYAVNLQELLQGYGEGKVKVVIEEVFPLENTVTALNKVVYRIVTETVIEKLPKQ